MNYDTIYIILIISSSRNQVVYRGIAGCFDGSVYCWFHYLWNLAGQGEVIRCNPYCYCVLCLFLESMEMCR